MFIVRSGSGGPKYLCPAHESSDLLDAVQQGVSWAFSSKYIEKRHQQKAAMALCPAASLLLEQT
jgi:hypothetical protein